MFTYEDTKEHKKLISADHYFIKDRQIINAILHHTGYTKRGDHMFNLLPGYKGACVFTSEEAKKLIDTFQLRHLEMVKCKEILGLDEAKKEEYNENDNFDINESF